MTSEPVRDTDAVLDDPTEEPDEFWLDLHFDWRNCTCGTGCLACEYGAP